MQSYTYLIIHKETGYFYYGLRLSNKLPAEQDLGIVYFTSSATIKTIIQAEGVTAFHWIIRKKFNSKEDASRWEYKVIRRMLKHPKILNKAVSPINVPGNWYTNGRENILGKYCPSGFVPGRTYHQTAAYLDSYKNQKNRRWWNNKVVSIHCEICPGSSWELGRLSTHISNFNGSSLAGKKWWNNGEIHYRGDTPPVGFIPGRIKFVTTQIRKKRSVEENKDHSKKMKRKRWWTDGVDSAFTEFSPVGWVPGRGNKTKKRLKK